MNLESYLGIVKNLRAGSLVLAECEAAVATPGHQRVAGSRASGTDAPQNKRTIQDKAILSNGA